MSIPQKNIEWAVDNGFNIFCSTCTHLHDALDKEQSDCGKRCSGPLFGDTFPEYNGFIPKDKFKTVCLGCGDTNATHQVILNGVASFGLCPNHCKLLDGAFDNMSSDDMSKLRITVTPLIVPAFDV